MLSLLGTFGSWFLVGPALLTLAVLLGVELVAWRAARQRAARQRGAIASAARAIAPGPACIEGTVRTLEGLRPAVIRLREEGSEVDRDGRWSHEWREVEHEVEANAFELVTDAGVRVEVRPPLRIDVRAPLRVVRREAWNARVREAAISDGDRVIVTGVLANDGGSGGYRSGEARWTLGPPAVGPMIVSTEPLARADERAAAFHLRGALGLALALVALGVVYEVDFLRWLGATSVDAVVVAHRARDDQGGAQNRWLELDVSGHGIERLYVPTDDYARITDGDRIPCLVLASGAVTFADEPSIGSASLAASIATVLLLVLGDLARRRTVHAWHERRPVVSGGTGRLE